MRQIKFRAWEEASKRMLNWSYFQHVGYEVFFLDGKSPLVRMQFTGLHDKNGKEIYEGDIIRGPVITDESFTELCPSLDSFHWYQELEDALEEGKPIEVIGNIYENPDLPKGPTNTSRKK